MRAVQCDQCKEIGKDDDGWMLVRDPDFPIEMREFHFCSRACMGMYYFNLHVCSAVDTMEVTFNSYGGGQVWSSPVFEDYATDAWVKPFEAKSYINHCKSADCFCKTRQGEP